MPSAEVAIANLLARYAERLDSGDYEGVGELFRDATINVDEMGFSVTGSDAARDFYSTWTQRYENTGTLKTQHVTTNLIIEADEGAGTAASRAYITVFQATDGFPLQPIYCGRYRDRFERVDGAWRFAERTIVTSFVGDMSRHAAGPDA